jgi:cell division protein FtsB
LPALPTLWAVPIICPFSGRLDHPKIPDHVLSTSEPKASRAKVHLAAPDRLIWVVVGVIVLWGVWAFGSELVLNLRLNHEVQTLRDQNAQVAASNEQTRKELAVGGSPAAMEEAARKAGFARPGEQVYVIVKPSESVPPAAVRGSTSPGVLPSTVTRQTADKHGGVIGTIENWWRSLWH